MPRMQDKQGSAPSRSLHPDYDRLLRNTLMYILSLTCKNSDINRGIIVGEANITILAIFAALNDEDQSRYQLVR